MKMLLVVGILSTLMQPAAAWVVEPGPYPIKCRLCDPNVVAEKAEAPPVIVNNLPSSDGWIKTLGVLLLGSTLTLLIQRQLKVWEMRFAFLREAMAIGERLDGAALKYLKASINITMLQDRYPELKTPKAHAKDVIAGLAAPGAMKIMEERNTMTEARNELSAVLFEAVNLLVPMPVLFGTKVQNQYMAAINCYSTERHMFTPTRLRESVREFHEEWKRFNKLAARACWMRYRRTTVGMKVLSKEDQELLLRVLHGADDLGKKEDKGGHHADEA